MNNDRKSRGLSGATIISFVVILVVVLWMANQLQMHQQEMTYTSFVSAVQEKMFLMSTSIRTVQFRQELSLLH